MQEVLEEDQQSKGRIEVLPVQWRKHLTLDVSGCLTWTSRLLLSACIAARDIPGLPTRHASLHFPACRHHLKSECECSASGGPL